MNAQDRERLFADMGEAAALPADHPRRREVLARVQQAGAWAEDEWIALLAADERLRVELARVPVPAGLRERLLDIPPALPAAERGRGWRRTAAALAVVAAMVLAAVVAWPWLSSEGRAEAAIERVAGLAVTNHEHRPVLTVESSDPSAVRDALSGATKMPVELPLLGRGYRIEGGRICRLAERPVVYTRWEYDGREHSLFQFDLEDFGLKDGFTERTASIRSEGPPFATHQVVMWSDGRCGYALVCEQGGGNKS